MASQDFQVVAGNIQKLYKQSGAYPPSGAVNAEASIDVIRSLNAGLYKIGVLLFRVYVTLESDAKITGASLRFPVVDKFNADNRNVNCEWLNSYDGSTSAAWYTDGGGNNGFTAGIAAVLNNTPIALSALNNLPRNGYAGFRLTISGAIPSGKNFVTLGVGALPILTVSYTRTGQPVIDEPTNNFRQDATQPLTIRWRHNNGGSIGQGRFVLERSINAGAYAVLADQTTPNQFYTVAGNTFVAGQTVKFRLTTYAQGEEALASDLSQEVTVFFGAAVAIPVVTAPVGQIGQASPQIVATSAEATRIGIQFQVVRLSDNAVISDSGRVPGLGLTYNVPEILTDLTNYKAQVRVWSAQDVASGWGFANFNTVFNPPMQPAVIASNQNAAGLNLLTITNPAPIGGADVTVSNIIERSEDNGVTWVKIKLGWLPNTPYSDRRARSGIATLYRVTAVGSTGAVKPSAAVGTTLTLQKGIWIADLYDEAATMLNLEGYDGDLNDGWAFPVEFALYENRRAPVALKDDTHELESFDATIFIPTKVTPFNPVNKYPIYEALIKRKSDYCLRTFDGQRFYGVINSLPRNLLTGDGKRFGYVVEIGLNAIDIIEAEI